jgi:hypothetical protein
LCRYGGDEFAIATTRTQDEALRLAERIRERIQRIETGVEGVQVEASIGVAGGKRGVPRLESHPSATLDDLINLASRASTQAKAEAERIVAAPRAADHDPETAAPVTPDDQGPLIVAPRVTIDACSMRTTGDGVEVTVGLSRGGHHELASLRHTGPELLEAFGTASAHVLSRFLPAEHRFTLEEIRVLPDPDGAGLVLALVRLETPRGGERLVGSVPLLEDRYRSAVNAVLDATNRRLGVLTGGDPFIVPESNGEQHPREQDTDGAMHPRGRRTGGSGA